MASAPIERIIKAAVERGASDLHIKAGDLFRARIDGKLVPLTKQRLTPEQTRAIAIKLMTTDEDRQRIDELKDYDCSWGMPGVGRFRVNILRQRSSFMIVMRVIPFAVPTLEELGLPPTLGQLTDHAAGLILVTGITGSGKSSTIAALLHHMNQNQQRHIVTIENPIEFLHRDLSCSMTQREVGVDTESVGVGLRAALRQDPDVIVVGDVRDQDTIDTAMKAAETGHLVISAIPTPDVLTTIGQVLSMLPREERDIGRVRFSEALVGIVAQQLLPRADGAGRVAAVEILIANAAIRDCLKDPARVVECLPGAELVEMTDAQNFVGAIKVKVGPLAMSYKGKAKFTEVNEETHQVRMVGDAREVGGSGSTKVTMLSTVAPLASGGGSAVVVDAEVELVGKIVQFGRGMIEEVSRQMFRQFSTCVRAKLEVVEEAQPAQNTPVVPETKAVAAAPLAFRALWAIIARFFRRLFGKSTDHTDFV